MNRRVLSTLLAGLLFCAPIVASAQNVDPIARGMAAQRVVSGSPTKCDAAAVNCMDLQVGGVSKFSVRKDGVIFGVGLQTSGDIATTAGNFSLSSGQKLQWNSDTILARDAANTLALRNGTSAQTFSVYNTFTDLSNYARGDSFFSGNDWWLATNNAGTGPVANMRVGTKAAGALFLVTNNQSQWEIDTSGNYLAVIDNSHDIGAIASNRPRNYFGAGTITAGGNIQTPPGSNIGWTAATQMTSLADGTLLVAKNSGAQPTVSTLGTCTSGRDGAQAWVTDATQTYTSANFGVAVTAGGSNHVPVRCDGSGTPTWKIG